jgi:bifunctional DNase/RNase
MKRTTILLVILTGIIFLMFSGYFVRSEDDPDLLEVDIEGLVMDPTTNSPVVILVGKEYKRAIPIFIGAGEAGAIARGMNDIETPRPMTHDLIKNILEGVNARVERIIITELKDNIFFAKIVLHTGGSKKIIDSRPSDAIALAIRTGSPIFVSADVMNISSSMDLTGWVVEENLIKHYGFEVQGVSDELMDAMGITEKGVLVSNVEDRGPADNGGLRRGDIIQSLQGTKITSLEDFNKQLLELPEQEKMTMNVFSSEGTKEVKIIPQRKED